jgi:hypothetical protein
MGISGCFEHLCYAVFACDEVVLSFVARTVSEASLALRRSERAPLRGDRELSLQTTLISPVSASWPIAHHPVASVSSPRTLVMSG